MFFQKNLVDPPSSTLFNNIKQKLPRCTCLRLTIITNYNGAKPARKSPITSGVFMANEDPFLNENGSKKEEPLEPLKFNVGGSKNMSNKNKIILLALLIIGLAAGAGMYLMEQEEESLPMPTVDPGISSKIEKNKEKNAHEAVAHQEPTPPNNQEPASPPASPQPEMRESAPPPHVQEAPPVPQEKRKKHMNARNAHHSRRSHGEFHERVEVESGGVSVPVLISPENGAVNNYDESGEYPEFSWSGGGVSVIRFSRNQDMRTVDHKGSSRNNRYEFARPAPGDWYWQVSNGLGKSEVRMFKVNPPAPRAITFVEPMDGGSVASQGAVTWKGDRFVTYYRVELSTQGWANPNYRFATTATQLHLQNVSQGQYEMRIGAFSEVSGRWEYTNPIKVTVK